MKRRFLLLFALTGLLFAQGNGKLQLHFIDVGQGDGALLISPGGQVVAFDIGEDLVAKHCDKPVAYYDQLGITALASLVVSHYHQDHIGCIPAVLHAVTVGTVEDRGKSYQSSYYTNYLTAIGSKRHTGSIGDKIILDEGTANPVTIEIIDRSCDHDNSVLPSRFHSLTKRIMAAAFIDGASQREIDETTFVVRSLYRRKVFFRSLLLQSCREPRSIKTVLLEGLGSLRTPNQVPRLQER
jgi:ribonuclease BN (tRNA processing enzyme)